MLPFKPILTIALTFLCGSLMSQNSIKLKKQKTTFFYTQLNLHGGLIKDYNGKRLDIANKGPHNQIAFQLLKKNQKNQQKGYIRLINPVAYSFRFSIAHKKSMNQNGLFYGDLRLSILDTWVKLKTRWDRTNIWIGNKSIAYGQNAKLDPVSSFMPNIASNDIGFAQDIGVFLKTPINPKLDLEISLTSGGLLNKPLLICEEMFFNNERRSNQMLSLAKYKYNNTWLLSSRIGNQSFNKNEIGLTTIAGKIANNKVQNGTKNIGRIGLDWIHKHYEKVKIGNQVSFGIDNYGAYESFTALNFNSNADFYLLRKIVLSTSISGNYQNGINNEQLDNNFTNANSISYIFSPHTRLRLNHFYSKLSASDEKQWGILLQFVTGFGKRN